MTVIDDGVEPDPIGYTTETVTARTGAITVTVTERALPLDISIQQDQLSRPPAELAADIMKLCRRGALRAGMARRAQLSRLGVADSALWAMGLPTVEDVARAEAAEDEEAGGAPQTWLEG